MHRIPGDAVRLQAGADDRSVGDGQDVSDAVRGHPGVGQDRSAWHRRLRFAEPGQVGGLTGDGAADQQGIDAQVDRASRALGDGPGGYRTGELGRDVGEECDRGRADT
jgi:hypothetical protein